MGKFQEKDRSNIDDIIALTPLQEGMLFHYFKDPGRTLYFEQLSVSLTGEMEGDFFEKAWDFVVKNNEMLRAAFRWEKLASPVQIILKEHKCPLTFYDLTVHLNEAQKKSALAGIKSKDRLEGFDLTQPPFRVMLCKTAAKEYEMILSHHHILYDGWSNGIILKEFFNSYDALYKGDRFQEPPLKQCYKEFVKWVRGRDKSKQKEFWESYLMGFEGPTEFSIKERKEEKESTGDDDFENHGVIFDPGSQANLTAFAKSKHVTIAAVFYSAWGILLQRYNNSEDVVFGTTVSGRPTQLSGIGDIVGLFIDTIPLRVTAHP
ncbi:MAG TPA: condensation domain-containing protein, partial [Candidatus Deferrimicrobium sp.]|nr:condensation domain-containing protein [Candidatus Deferrimicrobium sp.]